MSSATTVAEESASKRQKLNDGNVAAGQMNQTQHERWHEQFLTPDNIIADIESKLSEITPTWVLAANCFCRFREGEAQVAEFLKNRVPRDATELFSKIPVVVDTEGTKKALPLLMDPILSAEEDPLLLLAQQFCSSSHERCLILRNAPGTGKSGAAAYIAKQLPHIWFQCDTPSDSLAPNVYGSWRDTNYVRYLGHLCDHTRQVNSEVDLVHNFFTAMALSQIQLLARLIVINLFLEVFPREFCRLAAFQMSGGGVLLSEIASKLYEAFGRANAKQLPESLDKRFGDRLCSFLADKIKTLYEVHRPIVIFDEMQNGEADIANHTLPKRSAIMRRIPMKDLTDEHFRGPIYYLSLYALPTRPDGVREPRIVYTGTKLRQSDLLSGYEASKGPTRGDVQVPLGSGPVKIAQLSPDRVTTALVNMFPTWASDLPEDLRSSIAKRLGGRLRPLISLMKAIATAYLKGKPGSFEKIVRSSFDAETSDSIHKIKERICRFMPGRFSNREEADNNDIAKCLRSLFIASHPLSSQHLQLRALMSFHWTTIDPEEFGCVTMDLAGMFPGSSAFSSPHNGQDYAISVPDASILFSLGTLLRDAYAHPMESLYLGNSSDFERKIAATLCFRCRGRPLAEFLGSLVPDAGPILAQEWLQATPLWYQWTGKHEISPNTQKTDAERDFEFLGREHPNLLYSLYFPSQFMGPGIIAVAPLLQATDPDIDSGFALTNRAVLVVCSVSQRSDTDAAKYKSQHTRNKLENFYMDTKAHLQSENFVSNRGYPDTTQRAPSADLQGFYTAVFSNGPYEIVGILEIAILSDQLKSSEKQVIELLPFPADETVGCRKSIPRVCLSLRGKQTPVFWKDVDYAGKI